MPVNQDTRNRLGYMRYQNDTTDECFYCGDTPGKLYCDYVPPMDVAKSAELRAMVVEPFVYVTTCHTCKSALYTNRYKLRNPEDRKLYIASKGARRSASVDTIRTQLAVGAMKPWQGTSVDASGKVAIIDHDESMLHPDIVAAKRDWENQMRAEKAASHLQSTSGGAEEQNVPVSGPSSDVRGSTDDGKDILGF